MSEDNPYKMALESVSNQKDIQIAHWKAEAFKWQKEYATIQREKALLQEVLATHRSRTGEDTMPLTAQGAQKFLEKEA